MKHIDIGKQGIMASEIALGCMRMSGLERGQVEQLVRTALDQGITLYDHADIYGDGQSEKTFAAVMDGQSSLRQDIIIQTKCGIRQGYYDFSKEHILSSVEGSLRRLGTDYIDILLLHRPDTLVEPEEVAEAFDNLYQSGKVRHFGVSNHNPMQMKLLNKHVKQPLIINQLQFSITNTGMVDQGLNANMKVNAGIDRDGSVLDYCRLEDITIQPWSPFQYGFFEGVFLDNPEFPELNHVINDMASRYGVSNSAIAIAWILRHPAKMQPIVGTTNPERLRAICAASDVEMTREEWYAIYRAAGNQLP